MCMLNCGLKEELDSFYPDEDRSSIPNLKTMDRALAMLIYDEYVPMPMYRSSPVQGQSQRPHAASPLNSVRDIVKEDYSSFKMGDILNAIAHTAMEEHLIDERELSGWDMSMSPFMEATQSGRQTLFLADNSRQTLFLGSEKASATIKFVHAGMVEPRFPASGAFIRTSSPSIESSRRVGSWSSLDEDAQMDVEDTDWVIA